MLERAALEPWARSFAEGDQGALHRRLAWDAIEPSRAAAALSMPEEDRAGAPVWLERVLGFLVVGRDLRAGIAIRLEGVAFAELWCPWVAAALDRLRLVARNVTSLSATDLERLGGALGREIALVGERAAYLQFSRERAERPLGAGAYGAFIDHQLRAGLVPLYEEFPVLLRQSGLLVEQFVEAIAELLERWESDREEIARAFGRSAESISRLERLDSDRHAGGRRVFRLRFESGLELIYKPRPLETEARWEELCTWLRTAGSEDGPRAARVLTRAGYGWMEAIRPGEPTGEAGLERWFRRAGALAALADLVGLEDLHAENLIAAADSPVAIDLEMLLRPARRAGDLERGSVLDSGLVPRRDELARGGRVARWAGLGDAVIASGAAARGWSGLGGDDLRPVAVVPELSERHNLPRRQDRPVRASEFRGALVSGARAMYDFLLERRDALLGAGGPLERFSGIRTRLLFRPSQEYAALLDRSMAPSAQTDGVSASLVLEAALAPFAGAVERPRLWPLVAGERRAIEALDVPRFEAESNLRSLPLVEGGQLLGVLLASGVERLRRRFALWSEGDLEAQAAELERALAPPESSGPRAPVGVAGTPQARYERAARALASRLVERRLGLGDSAPQSLGQDLSRRVRGASLYDGVAGEAVLLTHLADSWHDGQLAAAAALARRSFGAGAEALAGELSGSPALSSEIPLGGFHGVGSWLWTLSWLDGLVPGEGFRELANKLVTALDPNRLAADRRLDVEGGLAGLVLGLLAFYDVESSPAALALARRAGELLIEKAEPIEGGLAWRGEGGRLLAGFAHGASGVARALDALGEISADERFVAAARGALLFERTLFDAVSGNWPVVLASGPTGEPRSSVMTAWCHGAAGIALARLSFDVARYGSEAGEELEIALATTAAAGLAPRDHLCCGSSGRAAILALAAERHRRDDWRFAAQQIIEAMLARAEKLGDFELPRGNDPALGAEWGTMRGRAGIVWLLAELSGVVLPGVLWLEAPHELERRHPQERA